MIKMNREDLIVLNDLVRVSSALSINRIKNYVIQVSKKENALIVENYQETGKYGVLLRKEMGTINKDEIISISDPDKLGEYLSRIADDDEVSLSVKDNIVLLKTKKDKLKLPCYDESEREIESRKRIGKSFTTKKYGDDDNQFTFYGREDPENPNPDAVCKIDLKKLKLKNISSIFEISYVTISAKNGKFSIGAKEKKITEIERTIKKEEKDAMDVEGECEIQIQDIDCINMLASYDGMTIVEMKEGFPLVLKKKLPKNRIGINYIISITEDIIEDEEVEDEVVVEEVEDDEDEDEDEEET